MRAGSRQEMKSGMHMRNTYREKFNRRKLYIDLNTGLKIHKVNKWLQEKDWMWWD
jgi:hypothetical protein